jgi:hypothetical protein
MPWLSATFGSPIKSPRRAQTVGPGRRSEPCSVSANRPLANGLPSPRADSTHSNRHQSRRTLGTLSERKIVPLTSGRGSGGLDDHEELLYPPPPSPIDGSLGVQV